jgi:hypothetical protein
MTDKEPTNADSQELTEQEILQQAQIGYCTSPYEEYPGYIQFPHPLMLRHVSQWWQAAVKANEDISREEIKYHLNQWHAYRDMILDNDGWHIENVTPGEVKADEVPSLLVSFILQVGESYVVNQLSPKQRGVLRSLL